MNSSTDLLRDYQLDMLQRIAAEWKLHRSVMVQMPTGTGKTRLLASLVRNMLRDGHVGSVWIIAHRRELVEQIEETVVRYGIGMETGLVRVFSIQWLARHWTNVFVPPELIVIDEAHHALANTYRELWSRYPSTLKLGLTATPCRLDGKGFTGLFDSLVTSWSVAEFIRKGWLSPFDYVSVRSRSEEQLLVDGLRKRASDGDYQIGEMDSVLNRRPSIERLCESFLRYASDKKGIVYAISISHARNIVACYSRHGICVAAIDSRTPSGERKRLVDEFRQGLIQVLVNVDVFSEGFDCPDVEFVQLARPTLSLSKYLQQVGRGLRCSSDKESCMLIDNVGLYRRFGLPVIAHDWQAMFEGRLSGRGYSCITSAECTVPSLPNMSAASLQDYGLEVVMTHERLQEYLVDIGPLSVADASAPLKAFRDRVCGLYGLKRGILITALPQFPLVFDVDGHFAAVRLADGRSGIVDASGSLRLEMDDCTQMKFMKNNLLSVTDASGSSFFIDLYNNRRYNRKPVVVRWGSVEMLKSGDVYFSRTQKVYQSRPGLTRYNFIPGRFYLRIVDYSLSSSVSRVDSSFFPHYACVCLLANDSSEAYRFCGALADGSIVIADSSGRYYYVAEGEPKRYLVSEPPRPGEKPFDAVVSLLKSEVEERERRKHESSLLAQTRRQHEQLSSLRSAVPFRSGLKWGLRLGERILVPPVYRNIQSPIGDYCAFEANPCQWGILMLDGRIVVEARYSKVEIGDNGIARLTIVPGKVRTVRL